MKTNTKMSWDIWPALALNNSVQRIHAETASIFENLSGGFDGKRKREILAIVKEIENRAIWLRMLSLDQMNDDLWEEE